MSRELSHEIYRQLEASDLLTPMRWRVWSYLWRHGPLTGNELDRGTGRTGAHARLSELERMGLVSVVGSRKCNVTGYTNETWDCTGSEISGRPGLSVASKPDREAFAAAFAELRRHHESVLRFSDGTAAVLRWLSSRYTNRLAPTGGGFL